MEWQEFYTSVGKRIRACRKAHGLSQKELASRINKTYACISKYERGEISIDIFTLHEIATALGIEPQYLLPSEPPREPEPALRAFQLPVFRHKQLWCYIRTDQHTILSGCLEIDINTSKVMLYMDLKDPGNSLSYNYIMPGVIQTDGPNIKIYCTNPRVKGDFIAMYFDRIKLSVNQNVGICASMTQNYQVRIMKLYLSPHQIRDKELLASTLSLTKEELNYARKHDSLIL